MTMLVVPRSQGIPRRAREPASGTFEVYGHDGEPAQGHG